MGFVKITPKQHVLIAALQQLGKATVVTLSKATNTELKATFAHLRRLHNIGVIHICEWEKGRTGHPIKVYKSGMGVDAHIDRDKHYEEVKKERVKKRMIQSNTYDPSSDIFHPRPDIAAAWLNNKIEELT